MNMDEYNNFFGQFMTHYARLLQQERHAERTGADLNAIPGWQAAQSHRQLVHRYHDMLTKSPGTGGYVSDDVFGLPDAPDRLVVTPQILRALAWDAAHLAQALIFGHSAEKLDNWWYDPSDPEGLSEWFPGRSKNPNNM